MRTVIASAFAAACLLATLRASAQEDASKNPSPPTQPEVVPPPAQPPPEVKIAATPQAAPAGEVAPVTPPKLVLEIHGGAYIWYYLPLQGNAKHDLSLYFANLIFDAKYEPFGLHLEPRFRDTKLRPFFGSNVWVQEAYGYVRHEALTVKLGKVYTRFGKFWDNSFYGNLPYFDGLKLSPDLGLSAEIAALPKQPFRINGYAQYFVNDGVVNGSLQNRDTVSVPGARKRNEVIVRAEPAYFFNEDASIALGLSAQYFTADLPDPVGKQDVSRLGADLTISPIKGLAIYADYAEQTGQHVTDYPVVGTPAAPAAGGAPGMAAIPGAASRHNHYFLTGAELTVWRVTGRFNFSYVDYSDLAIKETMYQPGVVLKLHENVSLITEYVNWNRAHSGTKKVDHSLNVVLYASF